MKHPNGVNLDNYGLTLVDLKLQVTKMAHGCLWVVSCKFSIHLTEQNRAIIWLSLGNKKTIGVENVGHDKEDYNQYEEMTLFTDLINMIKNKEKTISGKLMYYTRNVLFNYFLFFKKCKISTQLAKRPKIQDNPMAHETIQQVIYQSQKLQKTIMTSSL